MRCSEAQNGPTRRAAYPRCLRWATFPDKARKAKGDCSKYRAERHSSLTFHKSTTPSAPYVTATFFLKVQHKTSPTQLRHWFKGAVWSWREEIQTHKFNIYNVYEVMIQLFPSVNKQAVLEGKHKVPEYCWQRWQGPPHINKVKQY